ncbi:DUF1206 domain-containing protein [Streptomyces sp. R33]|uniref:DUF1206 domain-containing protein n=1 Tax=Streptomyces sp. R33 TaxID=3238629 RepID=A0AB39YEW4_9ACTN
MSRVGSGLLPRRDRRFHWKRRPPLVALNVRAIATSKARVLNWPGGRVLVGVVGAVLVIVGVVIVVRSLMRKFEDNLRTEAMSAPTRRVVAWLGVIGGVACGVIAAVAGLFIVLAAVTFDPSQAKGLDATLRSFAATPAGPVLLIAAAVGLLLFGLYSFCEARWRKAPEHDASAE